MFLPFVYFEFIFLFTAPELIVLERHMFLLSVRCFILGFFVNINVDANVKQIVLEGHLLLVSLPVAFLAAGTAVRGLAAPRTSEYQSGEKKYV